MADLAARIAAALADRYRIERHLGEGGMAHVYLAEDLKHHRRVAVKVLRPELAAVIGAERFVQEITTTASLQHPHILPLFDSGRTGDASQELGSDFLYYVMPYIEGETLRSKLDRETQLSVDEAVRLTADIADALDYAHRQGVIHRDIKPENILLAEGRPLVADFGIALAVSAAGGGRMTETGLSLGTPHYMSPEQATAEKHVTNRSDIYSLGCMLFEMLTGEPPHTGASAQAIIMKIVTEPARSVTALRKTVPPHIAAAAAQALEKLPADRFESAKAFADALRNPGFTGTSVVTGATATASRSHRVRTWLPAGVAAVALAVAAWALTTRPDAPPAPVVRYTMPLPIEAGLGNDFGSQIALSPDGTRFVYVSAIDGTPRLWMRERHRLDAEPLAGTEQAHQATFSPEGDRIAFITWDRKLKVISLGGAPPTTLADSGIVRGGLEWGEDGYIYVTAGSVVTGLEQRGIERIPVLGGPPERVTRLDTARAELSHRYSAWLPGGRGLAFVISRQALYDPGAAEIGVVDLKTGEHKSLVQGTSVRWSPTGHLIVVRADGALVALPFDPKTLEVTGPQTPLIDGVEVEDLSSTDITLSRSGTLVYTAGEKTRSSWQYMWIDRSGNWTPVDEEWRALFRHPVLSRDGRRIATTIVDGEAQIWVKDLQTGTASKLTFEGRTNSRPAWTADGQSIAYIADNKIAVKRADGSNEATTMLEMSLPIQEVDFARDGTYGVARVGSSPRGRLYGFRPGVDTVGTLLFDSPFDHFGPAISPDGKWLAYGATESGQPQVFVRPLRAPGSAKWQLSTTGGSEPVWSNNGRELYYRDMENRIVAVPILPAPTFSYGPGKVLFAIPGAAPPDAGHQMFDITPDDQRFLFIRTQVGVDQMIPLVVIDNFFTELRQKIAGR